MNGTYLSLWLREMRKHVVGRYIGDIRIRGRLVQLVFVRQSLYISLYPDVMALCVDQKDDQGYESLTAFSTLVHGLRIEYAEQDSCTPVLRIGLQTGDERGPEMIVLTVLLYRDAPNLMITKGSVYRKLFSRIIDKKARQCLWTLPEARIAELFVGDREHVERTILTEFDGIDQNLIKELTPERAQRLRDIFHGQGSMRPHLVSWKPLKISFFAAEYTKEYGSFNVLFQDAISLYSEMRRREQAAAEKKKVAHTLRRRIDRLEKKLLTPDEVERYRLIGNCILANLGSIKKGDTRAVVPGFYDHGTCEIALDPSKSPQENAQAYFARYKKSKRGQPHLQEKIRHLRQELAQVDTGTREPAKRQTKQKAAATRVSVPFRIFRLDSGADVYVGKNARSNDELTFSFARPHDYFFHVRGYQGSHVLLRTNIKRGQKAAKKDIETAAATAAFYSKAKKQKRVPISYTQRKYLKKSRKGKPGAVVLMREEVIFVDPALPADSTDQGLLANSHQEFT